MTLTNLRLINFQKHRKLNLEIDPRITTIVGSSDQGKSAIIRALRWVLTNQPNGDSFISHGATRCRVDVTIDGSKLSRQRGKGLNQYEITSESGEKQVYKAFGSDVPQAVQQLANVTDSVNIQQQHNSYFWLTLPPAQVTKELNKIVALDQIDRVVRSIRNKQNETKADLRATERLKQTAQEQLDSMKHVPDQVTALEQLDAQVKKYRQNSDTIDEMTEHVAYCEQLTVELTHTKKKWVLLQDSAKVLRSLQEELDENQQTIDEIDALLDTVWKTETQLISLKKQHVELSTEYDKLQKGKCPLCQK